MRVIQSPNEADIRARLLGKIEENPEITLQNSTAECQRLSNRKKDSSMVQNVEKSETERERQKCVSDQKQSTCQNVQKE